MTTELARTDLKELPNPIPLGRRIKEILLERKITPNSFYPKVGMGRGTFYDCLDGKRHISPAELRLIAANLKLTAERIKQEDTRADAVELHNLVQNSSPSKRAVKLGLGLLPQAVGLSEKFDILNDLGGAYYLLKQYNDAHDAWSKAHLYAEKLHDKFGDTSRLFRVVNNLVISFTIRKDFSSIYNLLKQIGKAFESDPIYAGTVSHSQALAACEMGNKEEYRKKLYDAFRYYKLSGNLKHIATALHNVASMEYELGNLEESKKHFQEVALVVSSFPELKFISYKGYSKTLLALGEKKKAIVLIQQCLEELQANVESRFINITAKFLILDAYATRNIESAKAVLALEEVDRDLYSIACKFLMDYYCASDDSKSLMKYYRIAGQHKLSSSSSCWRGL